MSGIPQAGNEGNVVHSPSTTSPAPYDASANSASIIVIARFVRFATIGTL